MTGYFSCDKSTYDEIEKDKLYHIISRIMFHEEGKPDSLHYYHSLAMYRGDGKWQEMDEIYFEITDGIPEADGSILYSYGMEPIDTIQDDTVRASQSISVIGYAPCPEFNVKDLF